MSEKLFIVKEGYVLPYTACVMDEGGTRSLRPYGWSYSIVRRFPTLSKGACGVGRETPFDMYPG